MTNDSRRHSRGKRRFLITAVVIIVVLMLAPFIVVRALEERFIYFPTSDQITTPEALGLDAEELELSSTDGVVLHGYYVRPESSKTPRAHVLLSHGNGGNLSGRLPLVAELVKRDMAVLVYDYRGYGKSTGSPTEAGVVADGSTALAALVKRAGEPKRVVLFGRSLGGGVTYALAEKNRNIGAVITDAAFTSIPAMAKTMPLFSALAPFIETSFDNLARIQEIDAPKLILHGTADELVPFEMARTLKARARPPVELVELPGAGHNDTFSVDPRLYFGAIKAFIDRHM